MIIKIPAIIRDFAPRWTKMIENSKSFRDLYRRREVEGEELDMKEFHRCIVGEVSGFSQYNVSNMSKSAEYGCRTCSRFAKEFDISLKTGIKRVFESELKAYEHHIKNKHLKQINERHLDET